MLSDWNMFVKKIYHQGKSKDSNYKFKQALIDASKRKHEMGSVSGVKNSHHKKSKKSKRKSSSMSLLLAGGRRKKTRKNRKH